MPGWHGSVAKHTTIIANILVISASLFAIARIFYSTCFFVRVPIRKRIQTRPFYKNPKVKYIVKKVPSNCESVRQPNHGFDIVFHDEGDPEIKHITKSKIFWNFVKNVPFYFRIAWKYGFIGFRLVVLHCTERLNTKTTMQTIANDKIINNAYSGLDFLNKLIDLVTTKKEYRLFFVLRHLGALILKQPEIVDYIKEFDFQSLTSLIDASKEEFQEESELKTNLGIALENLKFINGKIILYKESKFYAQLIKLLELVITIPMLTGAESLLYTNHGMKKFHHGRARRSKHETYIDVIAECVDIITYFSDIGYTCFNDNTSFFDAIIQGDDYMKFMTEANELKRLFNYRSTNRITIPHGHISDDAYVARLEKNVQLGDKILTILPRDDFHLKVKFGQYVNDQKELLTRVMESRSPHSLKRDPFVVVVEGKPGTGKSAIMTSIMQSYKILTGRKDSPVSPYVLNTADKYLSAYQPNQWGICFDDLFNTNPKVIPSSEIVACLLTLMSGIDMHMPSADLESKGKVKPKPEIITISTNNFIDPVREYFVTPAAFWRRCNIHIEIRVKEEWGNGKGTIDETKKIPPGTDVSEVKLSHIVAYHSKLEHVYDIHGDTWIPSHKMFKYLNPIMKQYNDASISYFEQIVQRAEDDFCQQCLRDDPNEYIFSKHCDLHHEQNVPDLSLGMLPEHDYGDDLNNYVKKEFKISKNDIIDDDQFSYDPKTIEALGLNIEDQNEDWFKLKYLRRIEMQRENLYTLIENNNMIRKEMGYSTLPQHPLSQPPSSDEDTLYGGIAEDDDDIINVPRRVRGNSLPRRRNRGRKTVSQMLSYNNHNFTDEGAVRTIAKTSKLLILSYWFLSSVPALIYTILQWCPLTWFLPGWIMMYPYEFCYKLTYKVDGYFYRLGYKIMPDAYCVKDQADLLERLRVDSRLNVPILKSEYQFLFAAAKAVVYFGVSAYVVQALYFYLLKDRKVQEEGNLGSIPVTIKADKTKFRNDTIPYEHYPIDIVPIASNKIQKSTQRDALISRISRRVCSVHLEQGTMTNDFHMLDIGNRYLIGVKHVFLGSKVNLDKPFQFTIASKSSFGSSKKKVLISRKNIYFHPQKDFCCIRIDSLNPQNSLVDLFCSTFKGQQLYHSGVLIEGPSTNSQINNVGSVIITKSVSKHDQTRLAKYALGRQNGRCGSPLVVSLPRGSAILGYHIGGMNYDSFSTILTSNDLNVAISSLNDKEEFSPIVSDSYGKPFGKSIDLTDEVHSKSFLYRFGEHQATVRGVIDKPVFKLKTQLRPTTYQKDLEQRLGKVDVHTPILNPGYYKSEWLDPYHYNMSETKQMVNVDEQTVRLCGEALTDYAHAKISTRLSKRIINGESRPTTIADEVKPLTFIETLQGRDGARWIDQLAMNTSAGFPYFTSKKKTPLFSFFEERWYPTEVCQAEFVRIENLYKQGKTANPLFGLALKDEPVSSKKIKLGGTRGFMSGPTVWNMVARKYLLPIFALLSECLDEVTVGVNPHSFSWKRIKSHLCDIKVDNSVYNARNHVNAGDFSKFDKVKSYAFMKQMSKFFASFYRRVGRFEEANIVECIIEDAMRCNVIIRDTIVEMGPVNPSGWPGTTAGNCVENIMMLCYAFMKANPERSAQDFYKYCRVVVFGDDNVTTHHPSVKFSHLDIAEQFSKIGIKYTMAQKDAKPRAYVNIDDVDFLKRSFKVHTELSKACGHEVVVAPLAKKSIAKMGTMVLTSKTIPVESQEYSILFNMVFESFFHGRQYYNHIRKFADDMIKKYGYKSCASYYPLFDYDYMVKRYSPNYQDVISFG